VVVLVVVVLAARLQAPALQAPRQLVSRVALAAASAAQLEGAEETTPVPVEVVVAAQLEYLMPE